MASCRLCILAVFCSLLLVTTFIPTMQSARCCLKYLRHPLPCRQLKSYTVQTITSACDIEAIVFQTARGRFVCADPSKHWTLRGMMCLQLKKNGRSPLKRST